MEGNEERGEKKKERKKREGWRRGISETLSGRSCLPATDVRDELQCSSAVRDQATTDVRARSRATRRRRTGGPERTRSMYRSRSGAGARGAPY